MKVSEELHVIFKRFTYCILKAVCGGGGGEREKREREKQSKLLSNRFSLQQTNILGYVMLRLRTWHFFWVFPVSAGVYTLGPPVTAFPDILKWIWMGNGTARY